MLVNCYQLKQLANKIDASLSSCDSSTESESQTNTQTSTTKETKSMSIIITHDGFAFRIPPIPSRYRANCSRDWGCFLSGNTGKMNILEASEAGLTHGKFVEMALCHVDQRILTFEPNYINEPFTEIWGIPVSGGMKTQFNEKCSELCTFLIHRQSQDKMKGLIEVFSRQAFNSWVSEGMNGNANEYAANKASEAYFNNIFRFQMVQTEGAYGTYFYIETTYRQPQGEFELAALKATKEIYLGQHGIGHCTDARLVQNSLASLPSGGDSNNNLLPQGEGEEVTQVTPVGKAKMLTGKGK